MDILRNALNSSHLHKPWSRGMVWSYVNPIMRKWWLKMWIRPWQRLWASHHWGQGQRSRTYKGSHSDAKNAEKKSKIYQLSKSLTIHAWTETLEEKLSVNSQQTVHKQTNFPLWIKVWISIYTNSRKKWLKNRMSQRLKDTAVPVKSKGENHSKNTKTDLNLK